MYLNELERMDFFLHKNTVYRIHAFLLDPVGICISVICERVLFKSSEGWLPASSPKNGEQLDPSLEVQKCKLDVKVCI